MEMFKKLNYPLIVAVRETFIENVNLLVKYQSNLGMVAHYSQMVHILIERFFTN